LLLRKHSWITGFLAYTLFCSMTCMAQVDVLMQHNDLERTGWNPAESILNQDNVAVDSFGMVFSRQVDDQIYAQPLVISGVQIGGGMHNIVLVATVNNTVYAFDADDPSKSDPYWKSNLTLSGDRPPRNTDMTQACGGNYEDFSGNFGIVGTPAIDTISRTLYVVARSVGMNGYGFVQYLHALDYTTGAEKPGSPVLIQATVPGTGSGSNGGTISFDAQVENQRPGLLLYHGVVYISWASHCDWGDYHGWVIGYDGTSLQQKYTYNVTPNGSLGGIWMSGQAPAVDDSGYIYLSTGNGTEGLAGNASAAGDRSESLIKLSVNSGHLQVKDFFTPDNYSYLDANDLDYGCDGVLLIPGTRLSLSGSKQSYLYLIGMDSMQGIQPNNANVLQMLDVNAESPDYDKHIHGSPVYFRDSADREYVYAWAEDGLLKQFPFNRALGLFNLDSVITGSTTLPQGMPGAMLAVTSDGVQGGTGILWAVHPYIGDANHGVVPGILQAFDADNITHELWNSNMNPGRDHVGNFAKFVCPTIANGKVYLATFSDQLDVYGLHPPPVEGCAEMLPSPWVSMDIGQVGRTGDVCDQQGVFTLHASGNDIWNNQDAFHFVYQPFDSSSGMITAQVKYMDYTDPWAKCGLMFRSTLDDGSPNTMMAVTPGNGAAFQDRIADLGASYSVNNANIPMPYWVRIIREGNTFTGYVSPDGQIWTAIDSVTIAMNTSIYAGIAYTAHNDTLDGTSVVDSVSLVYTPPLPLVTAGPELYPNPATYEVYISDAAFIGGDDQITVQLLNVSGQVVYQQANVTIFENAVIQLNLPPALSNGYYFIRMTNSLRASEIMKLLIMR